MPETTVEARVPETLDGTLRMTNTEFAKLSQRARDIINLHGPAGLRQHAAIFRDAATIERSTFEMQRWAEKNAEHELGIIDVGSEDTTEVNNAIRQELDEAHAELEDMREKIDRLERRNTDLLDRLAQSAVAVNAEPSQR